MTIDPRFNFWLSVFLAVCAFLSGAGAQLTDLGLSASEVKAILAVFTITMGLGNAVNAVLAAIPSKSDPASLDKFYLGPKVQK
jgi:hypothetical protein